MANPIADLISPDSFEFFARYFLAGFIFISVRSRFVVGERPKPTEIVSEAVVLSLINQLVFIGFGPVVIWLVSFTAWPPNERLLFLSEILLLPSILGYLAGRNLSGGWNNALLRRLSMPIEHPIRRAYDYAFTHDREPGFVILTFEDGIEINGYFGLESLAANDSQRSDIYLERLYDVGTDGQWAEKEIGRSAVISLQGVRSIEFLDPEGEKDA